MHDNSEATPDVEYSDTEASHPPLIQMLPTAAATAQQFAPSRSTATVPCKPLALYLFAGPKRRSDVGEFLIADGWDICEIDILRSRTHDLTKESLRAKLLRRIELGEFGAVLASPPCDTFTRVKFANNLGPKPARTFLHRLGFPWLLGETKRLVKVANLLTSFTFQAILAQSKTSPGLVFVEFPEDLGAIRGGQWHGTRPASIWQWPEMDEIRTNGNFIEMGVLQSDYGASYLKPTRILLRGTPEGKLWYQGPPAFDTDGFYTGPLPRQDPRGGNLTTLARKAGESGFRTSGTAAWPVGLCKWAAKSILLSLTSCTASGIGASTYSSSAGSASTAKQETYPICVPPPNHWKGGSGPPRTTYTLGKTSAFHDGAGLTSPGRWPPAKRVLPAGVRWEELRNGLYEILLCHKDLSGKPWGKEGIQRALLQLCCSHEIVVFKEEVIASGREFLQNWLARQCGDYDYDEVEIPTDQPFCLKSLFYLLREMVDADYMVIRDLQTKVTAGILRPLPRTPAIYEEQVKWRLNMDPLSDPCLIAGNYGSLEEHKGAVKEQFREEEQMGLMKEFTEAEFYRTYGKDFAISALAVIVEEGGQKIRVIHDATHKTCVNHRIKCRDKLRFPGVKEKHQLMRERRVKGEIVLSLLADFTKAHRWIRIRDEEHGFLSCQLEPGFIWTNRCGTFGVGSAAYWWSRLAGCLVRAVHGILGPKWAIEMLLYADDLELEAGNAQEREAVVLAVFIFLILGSPLKNRKFRGGFAVDWIGLHICNKSYAMGVSLRRAEWLIGWITAMIKEGTVTTLNFAGGLGRLNFAASALYHEKPWLGPLYAWIASVLRDGAVTATLPWGVKYILHWIAQRLKEDGRIMVVPELPTAGRELFRSDAKAEGGRAFLGGWDMSKGATLRKQRGGIWKFWSATFPGSSRRPTIRTGSSPRWNSWARSSPSSCSTTRKRRCRRVVARSLEKRTTRGSAWR